MIYYINRPFFSVFGPTLMTLNQIFSIKLLSKGLKSPIFVCLKSLRVGMTIFIKIHFLTPSFIETPYIVIRPTVRGPVFCPVSGFCTSDGCIVEKIM